MLESVNNVVQDRAGKYMCVRSDISSSPSQHRFGHFAQVFIIDDQAACGRKYQSGNQSDHLVRAAAGDANGAGVAAQIEAKACAVDQLHHLVLGVNQVIREQRAFDRFYIFRDLVLQLEPQHVFGLKLFDYLGVFDADVFRDLVELQQFAPRWTDILVGCQHGNQCAQ